MTASPSPSGGSKTVDPFLELPYAAVPFELMPELAHCSQLALFEICPVQQIIRGDARPYAFAISAEAIYLMKLTGEIMRSADFEHVASIVTNIPRNENDVPPPNAKLFAILLLHPPHTSDVVLAGETIPRIIKSLKVVVAAVRKQRELPPTKIVHVEALTPAAAGQAFREPDSARKQSEEIPRRIDTRDAVVSAFASRAEIRARADAQSKVRFAEAGTRAADASPHDPRRQDPVIGLSYATVPLELQPELDFCASLALFELCSVKQVVRGELRPCAFALSAEAGFLLKPTGEVLRSVDFEHIDSVYTNLPLDAEATPRTGDSSFLIFMLKIPQTSDLILVGAGCHKILNSLKIVLAAVRKRREIPTINFSHVDAKQQHQQMCYNTCGVPYREPKSARNQSQVPPRRIPTREAVVGGCASLESVAKAATAETPKAAIPVSPTTKRGIPTTESPTPEGSSPTSAGLGTADTLTGLKYVSLPQDVKSQFSKFFDPKLSALLWYSHTYHADASAAKGTAPPQVPFTYALRFAFLSTESLYVAKDDSLFLRCVPLHLIKYVFCCDTAESPQVAAPPVPKLKVAILFKFCFPKEEHDLLLAFEDDARRERLLFILSRVMTAHHPGTSPRVLSCKSVGDVRPELEAPPNYTTALVDLPVRGRAVLPRRTTNSGSLKPGIATTSTDILSCDAVIPKDLVALHDGLQVARVSWVGRMSLITNMEEIARAPSTEHGILPPICGVGFLTDTHFYVAENNRYLRCAPILAVRKLLVRVAPGDSDESVSQSKRAHILIDLEPEQHCIVCQIESANDAKRLFTVIIEKGRELSEAFYPSLGTFLDPQAEGYQTVPAPNFKLVIAPVPRIEGKLTYRERAEQMFIQYCPSKLPTAADELRHYKGREEDLIQMLVQKYGPEPTHEEPKTTNEAVANALFRQRLVRFCNKYAPERVHSVDSLLDVYRGREEEMFAKLSAKYGPEPPPPLDHLVPPSHARTLLFSAPLPADALPDYRARLVRFCAMYMPNKRHRVDEVLKEYIGREEDLFTALVKKYGPEPSAPRSSYRDRARRLLQCYNPERITDVDAMLRAYQGNEEEYILSLVERYGPEPAEQPNSHIPEASDIYECVDLTSNLRFATVPVEHIPLFPSLTTAAIYWFGSVTHWEPPQPVQERFAFLTATHLYVADSDCLIHRCVKLSVISCVFINSRRKDPTSACFLLFKIFPVEHDLFLSFADDFTAKRMLWILLEVTGHFALGVNIKACAVEGLSDEGIDAQCRPPEYFKLSVADIPRRDSAQTVIVCADDLPAAPPHGYAKQVFGTVPTSRLNPLLQRTAVGATPAWSEKFVELDSAQALAASAPGAASAALKDRPLLQTARLLSYGRQPQTLSPTTTQFIPHEVEDAAPSSSSDSEELPSQLAAFLGLLRLGHLTDGFLSKGLTLSALQSFDDNDLQHFGVAGAEDRKKILRYANDNALLDRVRDIYGNSEEVRTAKRAQRGRRRHSKRAVAAPTPQKVDSPSPENPFYGLSYDSDRSPQAVAPPNPIRDFYGVSSLPENVGIKTPALPEKSQCYMPSPIITTPSPFQRIGQQQRVHADPQVIASPYSSRRAKETTPRVQYVPDEGLRSMPPAELDASSQRAMRFQLDLLKQVANAKTREASAKRDGVLPMVPPPVLPSPSSVAGGVPNKPLNQFSCDDVAALLNELRLGEHISAFRRTDGQLLEALSKDDLRYRFQGDNEAADVLWHFMDVHRNQVGAMWLTPGRSIAAAPPKNQMSDQLADYL